MAEKNIDQFDRLIAEVEEKHSHIDRTRRAEKAFILIAVLGCALVFVREFNFPKNLASIVSHPLPYYILVAVYSSASFRRDLSDHLEQALSGGRSSDLIRFFFTCSSFHKIVALLLIPVVGKALATELKALP